MRAGTDRTPHVVIVGGGVAGLEALMALRDLAGDRVEMTLVAPEPDFTYKPLAVEEPFLLQPPEHRALDPSAGVRKPLPPGGRGASYPRRAPRGAVHRREPRILDADRVHRRAGAAAFRQGTTFRASGELLRIDDVLANAAAAPSRRIAFVVPPGVTWPLPIYELALMARRRAESRASSSSTTWW